MVEQIEQANPQTQDDAVNDRSLFCRGQEFAQSLLYSAVQAPVKGIRQLIGQIPGTNWLPDVNVIEAPKAETFGTVDWHIKQIGGALGNIVPMYAATRLFGNSGIAAEATAAESATATKSALGLVSQSCKNGVIYGGLLSPVDDEKNFWQAKSRNIATSSMTFLAMDGTSQGLSAIDRLSCARAGIPLKTTFGDKLIQGAAGSIVGGAVNAETQSLLSGRGHTNEKELIQSIYEYAITGTSVSAIHALPYLNKGKNTESMTAVPELKTSPLQGLREALSDRQKWLSAAIFGEQSRGLVPIPVGIGVGGFYSGRPNRFSSLVNYSVASTEQIGTKKDLGSRASKAAEVSSVGSSKVEWPIDLKSVQNIEKYLKSAASGKQSRLSERLDIADNAIERLTNRTTDKSQLVQLEECRKLAAEVRKSLQEKRENRETLAAPLRTVSDVERFIAAIDHGRQSKLSNRLDHALSHIGSLENNCRDKGELDRLQSCKQACEKMRSVLDPEMQKPAVKQGLTSEIPKRTVKPSEKKQAQDNDRPYRNMAQCLDKKLNSAKKISQYLGNAARTSSSDSERHLPGVLTKATRAIGILRENSEDHSELAKLHSAEEFGKHLHLELGRQKELMSMSAELKEMAGKPFIDRIDRLETVVKTIDRWKSEPMYIASTQDCLIAVDRQLDKQIKQLPKEIAALNKKLQGEEITNPAEISEIQGQVDRLQDFRRYIVGSLLNRDYGWNGSLAGQYPENRMWPSAGHAVQAWASSRLSDMINSNLRVNPAVVPLIESGKIPFERINGWVGIPMKLNSVSDSVGCDYLLCNAQTGEYYPLDFTMSGSVKLGAGLSVSTGDKAVLGQKKVPKDRQSWVLIVKRDKSSSDSQFKNQLAREIAEIVANPSPLNLLDVRMPSNQDTMASVQRVYELRRFAGGLKNIGMEDWSRQVSGMYIHKATDSSEE